ncbi:MAG: hypothetical protein HY299_02765 [Verrucomicrobia bacterium]|nr:hypothetical protein [Verrucomicrobiota bacterium]
MRSWTSQEEKEALAAISSLKRALGISNHLTKRDEFKRDELSNDVCHIYLPDAESAELMGEILHRIAISPRLRELPHSRTPLSSWRETINVEPLKEGGYEASIIVWYPNKFTGKVKSIIDKHISPDNGSRNR